MKITGRQLLVTTLTVTLAATNAAKADPLSAADLRKLAPGQYHVSIADNVKLEVKLSANGAISATTNKGDHDVGRWSINNDKMCVVFKRWLDHKSHCQALSIENGLIRGNGFTVRR